MARVEFINSLSALDARVDRNISDYFVLTRSIRSVRDFIAPGFAVIGLKGAGKTTLYRSLVEEWGGRNKNEVSVGLTSDTVSFDAYFEKINCLQFERAVKIGMRLFILRMIDENIDKFTPSKALDTWIARKNTLLSPGKSLSKLLARFQGLSIMGVGLTLRPSEKETNFTPLSADEVDSVDALLRGFRDSGVNIRVVIDDPDRLFTKGTTFDPHLLAGYILATNRIAADFPYIKFVHVLKSNVFDALWEVEEMANLPHDYFHYISWTEAELLDVVRRRLSFADIDSREIFEIDVEDAVTSISSKIRNGPRDLLRYLEIILKSSPDAKVGYGSIDEHEGAFKVEARRQMQSVYSEMYEGIESFCEAIFLKKTDIAVPDFHKKFQELRISSKPEGLDYGQPWLRRSERALKALVDAGLVDLHMGGRWTRPFEPQYFRFHHTDKSARLRMNAVFV